MLTIFDQLVHRRSQERRIVIIYFRPIQDIGERPNFPSLNGYNSAADYAILLKLDTEFDHVTADTSQT